MCILNRILIHAYTHTYTQGSVYTACDDTYVVETEEVKDLLEFAAYEMIVWRSIVAIIISCIYIMNMAPHVDDEGELVKNK